MFFYGAEVILKTFDKIASLKSDEMSIVPFTRSLDFGGCTRTRIFFFLRKFWYSFVILIWRWRIPSFGSANFGSVVDDYLRGLLDVDVDADVDVEEEDL